MIISDYPYKNENGFVYENKIKFYSDKNFKIKQIETDGIFDSVIDNYPSPYNYTETDMLIEEIETSIIEEKAKAYDIIMGVSE